MLMFSIYFIIAVVFSIIYFALQHSLKTSILAGLIWPVTASIMFGALLIALTRELFILLQNSLKKGGVIQKA